MLNVLYLFLLAALWSPSFLFMKIGLGGFPPLTLAACRVCIAAALTWAFLRSTGHTLPRSGSLWRRLFLAGLVGNAIPFAMFCLGETRTDSGPAAIINSTTPIFTVLMAHAFLRDERFSTGRVVGILIGFAGILTVVLPTMKAGSLHTGEIWGYAAFMTAAICYAASNVYARRHFHDVPARVISTAQLISAAVILAPIALLVERPLSIRPGAAPIAAVVTLATLGTALPFTLFFDLMKRTSSTFVSMVTYILPPVGIVLGAVFLDERVGWNHIAGCALILSGVMVVNGLLFRVVGRLMRGGGSAA